ncbi:hypothetical protein EIP86_011342 [Pleurotus ostreatoroseus]|nr:hypothetical protein EIP86_011342 [Pleurotus ostreatoroseus]
MVVKSTVRACKNVTMGYSSTQKKTRAATSNDPTPPTAREMNELANLSHNNADFIEIMEVLDKRLNDRGKQWRHVFKALSVLEYLMLYGSDNVARYCADNLYEVKTLREFQYIDDNGIDQGMHVRQVAKDITNLVLNPQSLQNKRRRSGTSDSPERSSSAYRRSSNDERRAAAESRRVPDRRTNEDRDLQRAIELSKQEEERRKAAVARANSNLFNDLEEPKKDDPLIDLSDIQIAPSAPLQVQYTQVQPQYTLQPQFTSVQPQYTQYTQFQPQLTYSNPYDAQLQQEAMQAEYLRQQAEWQQQQVQLAQQQQAQAQQEELLRQQQMLQYQQTALSPQQPQPTGYGSNNPFAAAPSPSPSLSMSTTSASTSSFTAPPTPISMRSASRNADQRHAELASAWANRGDDGVDTFGNAGLLRFGPTDTGRLAAQKTGATGGSFVYAQMTAQSVY